MRLAVFIAVLAAFPAFSQPVRQPTVTITATRRAQTVDDTLASVTVITRADIERSQAPDLITLLRGVPGIDVARTGGEGQATSVFLRGSNLNQTLVLVDGIRVASTNTGALAFEHLPLGQIERIEIVRGPRASWYGSDAIGGVIQVFTRDPHGIAAALSYGRWNRREATASLGAGAADGSFGATVSSIDFDGFSSQKPGGFGYDPDADGYARRSLGLHGQYVVGTQALSARTLSTRADVDFDQGRSAVDTDVLGATLEGPLSGVLHQRTAIGWHREDLDTPVFASRYRSQRTSFDWTGDLALGADDSLVFGVNWQRERGESRTVGSSGSTCDYCVTRRNLGIFASAQGTHGALDYQAAARRDHNSTFGGAATGQLAAGWRSSASTRWFASVGQGYRAPNLNELFSPGFGGLFGGNPLLGPERSHSIEVGADWRPGSQQLSVRAFRTRVRDLIAFEGGQTFTALNVARAAIDGVEFAWGTRIGQTQLDASATWQHARDTDTGLDLLRRAERKLALAAARPFGALLVGADLQYTSPRRDFSGELGGFVLANLRVERALGAAWRVGLRLDNATDRDYEQAAGFATPRRALLLTLRYSAP